MASKQADAPSVLSEHTVVDCDVHVAGVGTPEIGRKVAEYMDKPYRSYVDPDMDRYRTLYPTHGYPVSVPNKLNTLRMTPTDPEEHIQKPLCDELGVDHPLLNLMSKLDHVSSTDRALQEMRAINNVLIEHFLDDHDKLLGLCSLTTKKPDRAAEELDRMGEEDDIVGAFIHTGGQDKPLGDPRYDVMYEAAADNDLPITLHGTGSSMMWEAAGVFKELETYFSLHALNHPWEGMLHLTSLIAQGTPVKFPDLDFVFLESGIGWVPYMMHRLNREHAQRRTEVPLLEKTPEEYIRDSFYFATQPIGEPNDPSHIRQMVDLVGPESIVFATDHPHYDFDNPETIVQLTDHLDDEQQDDIFYRNASNVYGLDL